MKTSTPDPTPSGKSLIPSISVVDPAKPFLSLFVAAALVLYVAAAALTHYQFRDFAPQFTGNEALDQKMMFLRGRWPSPEPVGVVIGSSMALSNADTDQLQAAEGKPWMDLGAWSLSTTETENFLDDFRTAFAVREVVLATQYFELEDHDHDQFKISPSVFREYVEGDFNWVFEFAYRDVMTSIQLKESWPRTEGNPHALLSLVFTPTGAVPIEFYAGPDGPNRPNVNEKYLGNCQTCTGNLERLCRDVQAQGNAFTVVIPPLTHSSRAQNETIRKLYLRGRTQIGSAVDRCGGRLFDAADFGDFDDSCFVDFTHLNSQGMHVLTSWFIDWRRGHIITGKLLVRCTKEGVPLLSDLGP